MAIRLTRGSDSFDADRYKYDFRYCTASKGWAQLDSTQDAPYYGTWVNPFTRCLFNYCEGDILLTECDTEEDFIQAVRECVEWNKERDYFLGIDGMCHVLIIEKFREYGLGEFLH